MNSVTGHRSVHTKLWRQDVQDRLEQLREFRTQVRHTDVRIDSAFQQLIQDARSVLEIPEQEIAEALFVSRPTVNRWINGRNLPYLVVRKHAVDWLDEELSSKIRSLKHRHFPASSTGDSSSSNTGSKKVVASAG